MPLSFRMPDPNTKTVIKHSSELTLPDLNGILKLRTDVFVVEGKCCAEGVDGKDIDDNVTHCYAVDESTQEIVGYARIQKIKHRRCMYIRRVCVAADYRGSGVGQQVMQAAVQFCKGMQDHPDPENQADRIELRARAYLEHFYNKLGFVACSDVYLNKNFNIPEIFMALDFPHN